MRRAILLAVALLLASALPAAAWDPEDDWYSAPPASDDVQWWEPEPSYWWEPEPGYPTPDVGYEVPEGIYLVTEVFSADVVTTAGAVTTYTTETYRDTPGTYARVLETVATGAESALDGAAFNGRASLSDGRPVAGTYYENFVLTEGGFQPVSIVFFQDDREVAPAPAAEPTPVSAPTPPAPVAVVRPPIASVAPIVEVPRTVAPTVREERHVPESAPQRVTVGLSPEPLGDARSSLEILRGRAITLWVSATVDGAPARVISWRLTAGDLIALGAVSGNGDRPLRARWDRVGEAPTLLAASVETRRGPVDVTAEILVIVRAPALVP